MDLGVQGQSWILKLWTSTSRLISAKCCQIAEDHGWITKKLIWDPLNLSLVLAKQLPGTMFVVFADHTPQ